MPIERLLGAMMLVLVATGCIPVLRGTGDLGIVVERATGRVQVVETTGRSVLGTVEGLGDLSHAAAVFSRDGRHAFIFGRDGGLTKVDLLTGTIAARVVQAGNSIGGAISDDGSLVAVSNYEPGGIKVFDTATLRQVADIPAVGADGRPSKVVGLGEASGKTFIFTLYDAGEIWIADLETPDRPHIRKITGIGRLPYDGLVTGDGHFYIAGLFGEDGLALVDLWSPEKTARRILDRYGRGEQKLPVYKMPHLRNLSTAGRLLFLPAVGQHVVLAADTGTWTEAGRVAVLGQPVFAVARPGGRQVWVNFAHPDNDAVQVIDVPTMTVIDTLRPGKAILHMEFTPRGEQVWISARDSDEVVIYDAETRKPVQRLPADKPSGIFMSTRAARMGL